VKVSSHTGSINQALPENGFKITVNQLSKRFNREWIFRNFTHQFSSGNTYAITGPNGSGKSTLLQVLWGQVPPTSGSIEYFIKDQAIEINDIYKHISIATPYMDLIEEFTLLEHIQFHFKMKMIRTGLNENELIQRMYLESAQDKFIGNFSSGMKQRVKLALAFYTQSDILFLDEPGTNLDAQAFSWYQNELSQVPGDSMIFIASNNADEYPKNCSVLNIRDFKKS
jgi:ABC-type multidrug transport system ATPase subunit